MKGPRPGQNKDIRAPRTRFLLCRGNFSYGDRIRSRDKEKYNTWHKKRTDAENTNENNPIAIVGKAPTQTTKQKKHTQPVDPRKHQNIETG